MILRHVIDEDVIRFYRWWSDSETRRFNGTLGDLTWHEHLHWFCENMANPHWYVGQTDDGPVGAIRFDENDSCSALTVSIVVDPLKRRAGLGTDLIVAGTEKVGAELVIAQIHRFNTPSQRAFLKAGYTLTRETPPWMRFEHGIAAQRIA